MTRLLLDVRISEGYHSYVLELYDCERQEVIEEEFYGDMGYWGEANVVRSYSDALRMLSEKSGIPIEELKSLPVIYNSPWDDVGEFLERKDRACRQV